jgi:hypothetical protein
MPIKDLRNTTEISNIAHKEQEPIFRIGEKTLIPPRAKRRQICRKRL